MKYILLICPICGDETKITETHMKELEKQHKDTVRWQCPSCIFADDYPLALIQQMFRTNYTHEDEHPTKESSSKDRRLLPFGE